jgi:hypothetical protein
MTDTVFQKTSVNFVFFVFTAFKLNSNLKGATTATPPTKKKKPGGKMSKFWIVASYISSLQTVLLLFHEGL